MLLQKSFSVKLDPLNQLCCRLNSLKSVCSFIVICQEVPASLIMGMFLAYPQYSAGSVGVPGVNFY